MIPLLFALLMCTGSMEPTLIGGDRIALTSEFNLTQGDIYVYGIPRGNQTHYVIHRLEQLNKTHAYFVGDGYRGGEWINTELIKYRFVKVVEHKQGMCE